MVGDDDRDLWKVAAVTVRFAREMLDRVSDPAPASPLAMDDEACVEGLYVSDTARGCLEAALDNLTMWANEVSPKVFVEGVPVVNPPRPHFTLARAGMEAAAQAAWILSGDESAARVSRHDRLAVANLEEMRLAVRHIDADTTAAVVARIAAVRAARAEAIPAAPGYISMVRDTASVVDMAPDDAEVLWRTASAAAHGKLWFLEATHTTTVGEEFAPGRFRARREPDPGTISAVVTFASQLVENTVLRFALLAGAPLQTLIPQSMQAVTADMPRAVAPFQP